MSDTLFLNNLYFPFMINGVMYELVLLANDTAPYLNGMIVSLVLFIVPSGNIHIVSLFLSASKDSSFDLGSFFDLSTGITPDDKKHGFNIPLNNSFLQEI